VLAGAGLAALGVLAALAYLGCDLRGQLAVAGVIARVPKPLVFPETDDRGGGVRDSNPLSSTR
jgi:hypothetical protein